MSANANLTNNDNDGMSLSESETCKDNSGKTDFMEVAGNLIASANWKIAFILLIVGVILFSDVFIEKMLSSFDDAVSNGTPTTKGTTIQLILLTTSYLVVDLLVQKKFV